MNYLRRKWHELFGEDEEGQASTTGRQAADAASAGAQANPPYNARVVKTRTVQPLLENAGYSEEGGIQGLEWYKERLKTDGDGDIADEFLEEAVVEENKADSLKALSSNLKQPTGGDVIIEQGNVHVISPGA